MTVRPLVLALVLLAGAIPLAAQAGAPGGAPRLVLGLQAVRWTFCVDFLMDSSAAAKRLPNSHAPVRADGYGPLAPVLRRLIVDEAQYGGWIPAELCLLAADTLRLDNDRFSEKDAGKYQLLGFWSIAATPRAGTPDDGLGVVVGLYSTNWRVERSAELAFLDMDVIKDDMGKVPESPKDRYEARIGKTVVTWDGFLAVDSTAAQNAPERRWWLDGLRNAVWTGRLTLRPAWERRLAGSLRISGKDDLAKALHGSPIRMLGPMYSGGSGEIRFYR